MFKMHFVSIGNVVANFILQMAIQSTCSQYFVGPYL
jgi:hypothetical protein